MHAPLSQLIKACHGWLRYACWRTHGGISYAVATGDNLEQLADAYVALFNFKNSIHT